MAFCWICEGKIGGLGETKGAHYTTIRNAGRGRQSKTSHWKMIFPISRYYDEPLLPWIRGGSNTFNLLGIPNSFKYLYLTSNTKYFQSIFIWPQILNTQSCQILLISNTCQILFWKKDLSFPFKRGLIYHPSTKTLVILAFFMWGPNAWGKKASLATLHHLRKKSIWQYLNNIWLP